MADQIGGHCRQSIITSFRPAVFDRHVLALAASPGSAVVRSPRRPPADQCLPQRSTLAAGRQYHGREPVYLRPGGEKDGAAARTGPEYSVIAMLLNPTNPSAETYTGDMQTAAANRRPTDFFRSRKRGFPTHHSPLRSDDETRRRPSDEVKISRLNRGEVVLESWVSKSVSPQVWTFRQPRKSLPITPVRESCGGSRITIYLEIGP
jgi:hypothetical protein